MPRNQYQRMIFALITVVITVHCFVFYSLYVVNGNSLMEMNGTGRLVCFNFPFAFFTQMFFIQPCVRGIFKTLFRKDIAARKGW